VVERSFDMTLDRAEFLRLLPDAVGGEAFTEGDGYEHREPDRRWRIRLVPLPPFQLGAVALARLRVELGFEGYAPAQVDDFLARFLAHFQRGGG
jgi:hypothetical protein